MFRRTDGHSGNKYLAFAPVEGYGEADDPSTPFGHVYGGVGTSAGVRAAAGSL